MKFLITVLIAVSAVQGSNITQKQMERLEAKKEISYEDLAHENPGCPENSICSRQMGKKMKQWDAFIKGLTGGKKQAAKLEAYRKKHGLPVTFLAGEDSAISLDPILYNSRCPQHNPEDKKATIYKGIQFFRNNPSTDNARFDPAYVYGDKQASKFEVPYEEAPVMIQNKSLIIPRDHENLYYHLAIASDGSWEVAAPDSENLSKALSIIENTECPGAPEGETADSELHLKSYCKKIWNADEKKAQTIRLYWSCP